jgi:hypothetical protein
MNALQWRIAKLFREIAQGVDVGPIALAMICKIHIFQND